MPNKIFVSVIIPTRNRPEMIKMSLRHLLDQDYSHFETIIVDSSSNEDTREIVKQFSGVKYIFMQKGKDKRPEAKNIGIRHSKGDFVAFIDDDCMVRKGWLQNLMRNFTSKTTGAVGGRVINQREQTEPVYDRKTIGKILKNGQVIANWMVDCKNPIEVDHLPGGNWVIRRDVFDKIGYFDPAYTGGNYLEETDMSVRIAKAGFKLIFEPQAIVDHLQFPREGDKSRMTMDTSIHFYVCRNLVYFYIKNFGTTSPQLKGYLSSNNSDTLKMFILSSGKYLVLAMLNISGKITGFSAGIKYKVLQPIKKIMRKT